MLKLKYDCIIATCDGMPRTDELHFGQEEILKTPQKLYKCFVGSLTCTINRVQFHVGMYFVTGYELIFNIS